MRKSDLPLLLAAGVVAYLLLARRTLAGIVQQPYTPIDSTTGLPIEVESWQVDPSWWTTPVASPQYPGTPTEGIGYWGRY